MKNTNTNTNDKTLRTFIEKFDVEAFMDYCQQAYGTAYVKDSYFVDARRMGIYAGSCYSACLAFRKNGELLVVFDAMLNGNPIQQWQICKAEDFMIADFC